MAGETAASNQAYSYEMSPEELREHSTPPVTYFNVRIQPPCIIGELLVQYHSTGYTTLEHLATTRQASAFVLSVSGFPEGEEVYGPKAHASPYFVPIPKRVEMAKTMMDGIIQDLNNIDDLSKPW